MIWYNINDYFVLMEKVVELRLTKTQYERLLRYSFIGNYIENFDKEEPGEREWQFMLTLLSTAYLNELDCVRHSPEGFVPSEKVIRKMEKSLAKYDRFVLEKAAMKTKSK